MPLFFLVQELTIRSHEQPCLWHCRPLPCDSYSSLNCNDFRYPEFRPCDKLVRDMQKCCYSSWLDGFLEIVFITKCHCILFLRCHGSVIMSCCRVPPTLLFSSVVLRESENGWYCAARLLRGFLFTWWWCHGCIVIIRHLCSMTG